MFKKLVILAITLMIFGYLLFSKSSVYKNELEFVSPQSLLQESPRPTPMPTLKPLPESKLLNNNYHIFQSFNNCGPASLSMYLSYYNINKSQEELGNELRPYQIPGGDNDDKSVTLEELALKGQEYGLVAFHRPNGNVGLIKNFINNDIPVLTRTWLHKSEDIGHYRIVKGFDDTTGEFIQDDSYQNHDLRYSYPEFNELWKKFNYEYLVLIPKDKEKIAQQILGEDLEPKKAWENAVKLSKEELSKNPDDIYAGFNLSVAYHNIGEFGQSIREFEKVHNRLPFRTLWYQIEPIDSYYQVGDYQNVFEATDSIINNFNRAYSEAYILRGQSYLKMGDRKSAKTEFEKAVFYNENLKKAQDALASVK
jgi:tetratricopeptide (TPR) repeat protein